MQLLVYRRRACPHRWILALLLGLLSAAGHAAPGAGDDPVLAKVLAAPLPDAASCPDPLVIWEEKFTTPRVNVAHFLRIDLTDKRIAAFVALSADPDGPLGPAEGVLTPPDELMRHTGALALVNANAFAAIASIHGVPGKFGWYAGRAVAIEGLAVGDSTRRSPDTPQRLAFWLDDHGKPHLGHPAASDVVCQAVADWGAPLLVSGRNVAPADPPQASGPRAESSNSASAAPLHPRSMLGFDAAGCWLLLVVVDGRQPRYSLGMTLAEGAALMQHHGCSEVINLDGGGSSILIARDASGKPLTINHPSDGTPRPVPVMIGVRPAQPEAR